MVDPMSAYGRLRAQVWCGALATTLLLVKLQKNFAFLAEKLVSSFNAMAKWVQTTITAAYTDIQIFFFLSFQRETFPWGIQGDFFSSKTFVAKLHYPSCYWFLILAEFLKIRALLHKLLSQAPCLIHWAMSSVEWKKSTVWKSGFWHQAVNSSPLSYLLSNGHCWLEEEYPVKIRVFTPGS